MNNQAMFKISYGLYVVSTKKQDGYNACIINTAMQVTDNPKQICICVNKSNYTHDLIKESKRFCVSVLSVDAEFSIFKHFGFNSGRNMDKFEQFKDYKIANGLPYITIGTNAYISVNVENMVDVNSHTMFIGTVEDMEVLSDRPSATYEYYFENIKPKPIINNTKEPIWRCKICGHEYKGEVLPEDYVCPLCKHTASDFEKI